MAGDEKEQDDLDDIPDEGAVFTFGKSRFADNEPNRFWIKSDAVITVSCGDDHTALITESGRVFSFGKNEWGQLGHGNTKTYTKPTSVKALKGRRALSLVCGKNHTLFRLEDGELCGCGANSEGELGLGDKDPHPFPSPIPTLKDLPLSMLAAGAEHSAILTASGQVYVWGSNNEGQLGLGSSEGEMSPTKLNIPGKVNAISCGYHHTAIVTADGNVMVCGEGEGGKLGLGEVEEGEGGGGVREFTLVEALEEEEVASVSCGAHHTTVLTSTGRVLTMGGGLLGELGLGPSLLSVHTPTHIDLPSGVKIASVTSGYSHTLLISDQKVLYAFGDGKHGKLGPCEEGETSFFTPKRFPGFEKFDIITVGCGGGHSVVVGRRCGEWEEREGAVAKKERRLTFKDTPDTFSPQPSLDLSNPRELRRRMKSVESVDKGNKEEGAKTEGRESGLHPSLLLPPLPPLPLPPAPHTPLPPLTTNGSEEDIPNEEDLIREAEEDLEEELSEKSKEKKKITAPEPDPEPEHVEPEPALDSPKPPPSPHKDNQEQEDQEAGSRESSAGSRGKLERRKEVEEGEEEGEKERGRHIRVKGKEDMRDSRDGEEEEEEEEGEQEKKERQGEEDEEDDEIETEHNTKKGPKSRLTSWLKKKKEGLKSHSKVDAKQTSIDDSQPQENGNSVDPPDDEHPPPEDTGDDKDKSKKKGKKDEKTENKMERRASELSQSNKVTPRSKACTIL